jgi:2,4-diketo-3-deoxy-L-fuconate hydrolase
VKLVSFLLSTDAPDQTPRVGALLPSLEEVVDFAAAGVSPPARFLDWFDLDKPALHKGQELLVSLSQDTALLDQLRKDDAVRPRSTVKLQGPVGRPGKILCIGLNYRDHAAESKMEVPERPILFSKFTTATTGPNSPVLVPEGSEKVDYEAELAVVIGRHCRKVAKADAYHHVLGYMNLNDVSARDFQFADGQWQRGKACDTFCPTGPFIATADEIGDPHKLQIQFRLNGATLQDSSTAQLIFNVPELVSYLSGFITLEPGDLILTGTPPGVGFARKPPVYVQPGDVMEVEVAGLGVLRNVAVAVQG